MSYTACVPRVAKPTADQVLEAVRQAGGAARPALLRAQFAVPRSLVHRRLDELTKRGDLERARHGLYRLPSSGPQVGGQAERIIDLLDRAALDAHITGLGVLLPYVHQFVRDFPQLIYAEPLALRAVEDELTDRSFVVVLLGHGARPRQTAVEDVSRLALLRAQPNADQYGVHDYVAPMEKAWVDLLRETHRGTFPMEFTELGRILRNMVDGGANLKRLKHYSRRQGYLDWVRYALGESPDSKNPQAEAVRGGFSS
jgi:hypothetical protein